MFIGYHNVSIPAEPNIAHHAIAAVAMKSECTVVILNTEIEDVPYRCDSL